MRFWLRLASKSTRKRLDVRKAIKTAGEHTVALNIYRDIHVDLQLMVGVKAVEEVEEAVVEAEAVETEATEEAASSFRFAKLNGY